MPFSLQVWEAEQKVKMEAQRQEELKQQYLKEQETFKNKLVEPLSDVWCDVSVQRYRRCMDVVRASLYLVES